MGVCHNIVRFSALENFFPNQTQTHDQKHPGGFRQARADGAVLIGDRMKAERLCSLSASFFSVRESGLETGVCEQDLGVPLSEGMCSPSRAAVTECSSPSSEELDPKPMIPEIHHPQPLRSHGGQRMSRSGNQTSRGGLVHAANGAPGPGSVRKQSSTRMTEPLEGSRRRLLCQDRVGSGTSGSGVDCGPAGEAGLPGDPSLLLGVPAHGVLAGSAFLLVFSVSWLKVVRVDAVSRKNGQCTQERCSLWPSEARTLGWNPRETFRAPGHCRRQGSPGNGLWDGVSCAWDLLDAFV